MAIADFDPSSETGQRFGRYTTLRRLAVGGMAELVLACTTGPGDFRKVVAIKRLLPQHVFDPQLLRMFLDEARLMARMSHPHIPQVYDVCDAEDAYAAQSAAAPAERLPYFIMEYVHGRDLRAVLTEAGGPLPIGQVVAVGAAVAAGLHHAHELRSERGEPLEIVHRDVSPSNVLISYGGNIKVTDFGVAKWVHQRSLTHQGQLKGKFAHMSPEQCQGQPLDRRSDVFALGTLLYEMAAGSPAHGGDSDFELMSRIVNHDVAPPHRGDGQTMPAALGEIIMRALRRARDERFASAQEVQLALERFARDEGIVVSPLRTAEYMESLWGAQVAEWRESLLSGRTLAEHLQGEPPPHRESVGGARAAVGESDPRVAVADRTLTDPGDRVAGGAEEEKAPRGAKAGELAKGHGDTSAPTVRRTSFRAPLGWVAMAAGVAVAGAAALALEPWATRTVESAARPLPVSASAAAPRTGSFLAAPPALGEAGAGAGAGAGVGAGTTSAEGEDRGVDSPVAWQAAASVEGARLRWAPSSSSRAGVPAAAADRRGRRDGRTVAAKPSSLPRARAAAGGPAVVMPAPTATLPAGLADDVTPAPGAAASPARPAPASVGVEERPTPAPPETARGAPAVKLWDPDSPIPP